MKLSDFPSLFAAFKSDTTKAFEDTKAALAVRDKQISDLSAKLEALEAASKIKADDSTPDESSELDSFISDLQELINKYSSDESDESDDSTEDADDSDTSDTSDDAEDANDESAKKAANTAKLKKLAKSVATTIKAKANKQATQIIASIGIPAPVATKVEGQKPNLTGKARLAAAFTEQLNQNK